MQALPSRVLSPSPIQRRSRWRGLYALGGRVPLPPPGGGDKRGQGTDGSLSPLDTPDPPLDATSSGRASKCEGPTGAFGAPKISRLIEAEFFAAESKRPAQNGRALLCAADNAREIQGITAFPKSARRTEPSPRNPRFAARPKGVAAQRRVWGRQEGAREPYGALAPTCPPAVGTASPGRRRRPLCTLTLSVNLASSGEPVYRRKVSPLLRVKNKNRLSPTGNYFNSTIVTPCSPSP